MQQVGGPLTHPDTPGVGGTIGCLDQKMVVFIRVFELEEINCGYATCVIRHEYRHIRNLGKACTRLCHNMPNYWQPLSGSDSDRQKDEMTAYAEEVNCLMRAAAGASRECQHMNYCHVEYIGCLSANAFNSRACSNFKCSY
jgi:hypothetical protein